MCGYNGGIAAITELYLCLLYIVHGIKAGMEGIKTSHYR